MYKYKIVTKHDEYFKDSNFILNLLKSFSFFITTIIISHYFVVYATINAGNPLNDLILNS